MKLIFKIISISLFLSVKLFAQSLTMNVKLKISEPIAFFEPLLIEYSVENNSENKVTLPQLFCCTTTKLKYWVKGSKDTSIYNNQNNDYSNFYDIILPYSTYKSFNSLPPYSFYFVDWNNKVFLLKNRNKMYQVQLDINYFIDNKEYSTQSNIIDFQLEKLSQEDSNILKSLKALGSPFEYLYGLGKKENYDIILNNCDKLIEKYQSKKLTPYFLKTISSIYNSYEMENDFMEDNIGKRQDYYEKAESHFTKLLSYPNISDYQKQVIKHYQQEYRKRISNEKL